MLKLNVPEISKYDQRGTLSPEQFAHHSLPRDSETRFFASDFLESLSIYLGTHIVPMFRQGTNRNLANHNSA